MLVLSTRCVVSAAESDDLLVPLRPEQVQVGGELGRRIEVTIKNNLLVLDVKNDFLKPFQEKKSKGGYIGIGKLIDAAVRFAANTDDAAVIAKKKQIIDELIQTQEPDGYIGMMDPEFRVKKLWDIHEIGYIIYGLESDYEFFGTKSSLQAAQSAADYLLKHWKEIPEDWDKETGVRTGVSVTGLERALIRLTQLTGQQQYLDFCKNQRDLPNWDLGIVIGRRPMIEGHVYAYLCRSLAQLELFRVDHDPKLLHQTKRAMDFLTEGDGLTITGGAGQQEIWTADQDLRGQLGETCATAYQIRMYDSLLRLQGDSASGDLIERSIHNALFAAQSPDGRKIRYYSPGEGPRIYYSRDIYCCPGNYRRIIAELPSFVFYRAGKGFAVNLYTDSKAEIGLPGEVKLVVRQETEYPKSGKVLIHVDPSKPSDFPVQLRIPSWCSTANVSVNGKPVGKAIPGGQFYKIQQTWRKGDTITLKMPMPWRLVRGRQRQSGRVAVMRGPLVFCLNPSQNKTLASLDAADLSRITLDPQSFKDPVADDSIIPGGVAAHVQAWSPGFRVKRPGDLELVLTQFVDPDGQATYFRLPDLSIAVDDELFSGIKREGAGK
ncbi:MAG: glycoside hydrolase family 127 protein [Verrucomicrobiota bacterium]